MTTLSTLDTQCIEILGQNFLTEQLIRGGIEIAKPIRDRGVDLIAYIDKTQETGQFISRPLQLKVSSKRSFTIHRKYERIPNLLMVFVWHANSEGDMRVYAMTYAQAVSIADQMGWTKTDSWKESNQYSVTRPSKRVEALFEPFWMNSEKWREVFLQCA